MRTDDIRHNGTETKTSITVDVNVAGNRSTEAQTSIFVGEQSTAAAEEEDTETSSLSSTSVADVTVGEEKPFATTSSVTTTTTTASRTTASFPTSEQGFEPPTTLFPLRDVDMTMTPRSTRPTGTTTTLATTTTTFASGRINPSLLNLLGRG